MAHISVSEYTKALVMALEESSPEDAETVVSNLVAVMKENGDLGVYEEVIAEYERLSVERGKVRTAEATFARGATENSGILDELNSLIGPELEVRSRVDESLIGGMVLRVDDTLIDASVKGQLERMRKDLQA